MTTSTMDITVNGKEKTVKMTFGLLNQLASLCAEPEDALLLALDGDLRPAALKLMLSDRDKDGKIKTPLNVDTLDVDFDEVSELLDWAGAHVLDFFLKAAGRTKKTGDARKAQMEALQPSSSGGAD